MVTKVKPTVAKALHHLEPLIEERRINLAKHGHSWIDRPVRLKSVLLINTHCVVGSFTGLTQDDLLQWLIEKGSARGSSSSNIVERFLLVNFAAIHTTSYVSDQFGKTGSHRLKRSKSITHAIYHLAELPALQQTLREEIESVVEAHGWDGRAAGKMRKLDSFLKESQRWNGISISKNTLSLTSLITNPPNIYLTGSLSRTAMRDVVLNDGTFVPKGTLILAAAHAVHHDENYYNNPMIFNPFRFCPPLEQEEEVHQRQFTTTSLEYLPWGHGHLAWCVVMLLRTVVILRRTHHKCSPGRFFAASEMKLILARMLIQYSMKLGEDGSRPRNLQVGHMILPASGAEILFKRRPRTEAAQRG